MADWQKMLMQKPGKHGLRRNQFSRTQMLVFLLVFGVIGIMIYRSFAASNPNLPGDLNNDNVVNITDLSVLLSNYGTSNAAADINGDGAVNVLDLSILLSHYGQTYTGGGTWQATLANPVPPGSFWTKTISQLGVSVDQNSSNVVNTWVQQIDVNNSTLGLTKWGVAEAMTTGSDLTYSLQNTCEYSCNLNRYGNVPIPTGTQSSPDGSGGDFHLAILDKSGKTWDMWHAIWNGSTWTAGCGMAIDLNTEINAPSGVCGSTNGNMPQTLLALKPNEIKSGVINHPLAFASPGGGGASIPNRCPASSGIGNQPSTSPYALANGMLFRLNPSYNVAGSSLSAWEKTIATALQTYGMYYQDGSGNMQMVTTIPINQGAAASWASVVGWSGTYQYFSPAFPWNQLQLMTKPC